MSTMVVTPPAAAARVAVSKPSHSVRPGSLTWTCASTSPGETTRSPTSITSGSATRSGTTASIRSPAISTVPGDTPSGRTTRRLLMPLIARGRALSACFAKAAPHCLGGGLYLRARRGPR